MRAANTVLLATRGQLLESKLTDCLEQPRSRRRTRLGRALDQAVIDERRKGVDNPSRAGVTGDRLGRLDGKAARKRPRRVNMVRAPRSSSARLHEIVSPNVRWRGGLSRGPPVSSSNGCASRGTISAGDRSLTRAAASSIANGRPSTRAQIAPTAPAFASERRKSGRAALARSRKSSTPG